MAFPFDCNHFCIVYTTFERHNHILTNRTEMCIVYEIILGKGRKNNEGEVGAMKQLSNADTKNIFK